MLVQLVDKLEVQFRALKIRIEFKALKDIHNNRLSMSKERHGWARAPATGEPGSPSRGRETRRRQCCKAARRMPCPLHTWLGCSESYAVAGQRAWSYHRDKRGAALHGGPGSLRSPARPGPILRRRGRHTRTRSVHRSQRTRTHSAHRKRPKPPRRNHLKPRHRQTRARRK